MEGAVCALKDQDVPEIEVTPEMIEAGADVIWTYFSDVLARGSGTGRETAIEVYRAMKNLEMRSQSARVQQTLLIELVARVTRTEGTVSSA
jgi:hypothetical protein